MGRSFNTGNFAAAGEGLAGQAMLSQGAGQPPAWGSVAPNVIRDARTSNTQLAAADKGKLIDITSGTFTQTFVAAATLISGWYCYIRNAGTGQITLDPNGSETIDGLTSFVMYPGEVRLVQCDGTALRSVVLNAFYSTFTASGTFTKPPGYSSFEGLIWAGGGSGRKDSAAAVKTGGAGGACASFKYLASQLSATESVTIGNGGAAQTANATNGNAGQDSTFKTTTAYGGQGGNNLATAVVGGSAYISGLSTTNSDVYGGATTGSQTYAYFGGAAPGTLASRSPTVFGGGAGGSIDASDVVSLFGTTVYGGAGGAASLASNGTDGTAPGGGGGATKTGTQSGAGARGEARIWGVI